MRNFTLIMTDENGNTTSAKTIDHFTPEELQDGEALFVRSKKAAISTLWDGQTRNEMEDSELDRYATAKRLLRKKRFERARKILATPEPSHADALNLLGVLHESLGNLDDARNCYDKAFTADKDCWAASMNYRRIYELATFGNSTVPMYL